MRRSPASPTAPIEAEPARPGVFSSYIAPLLVIVVGTGIGLGLHYGPAMSTWADRVEANPSHAAAWCSATDGLTGAFCDGVRRGLAGHD